MKVKVWYRLMAMAFLGLTLTACVDIFDNPVPGQRVDNGDDASDNTPYQVTEVSVNDNGESTKTVTLRYYEDMPHVAYIAEQAHFSEQDWCLAIPAGDEQGRDGAGEYG